MGKKNHFIIVGRTSEDIGRGIVDEFGDGGRTQDGHALISHYGQVIQARVGTYEDGEASAELFVDGKLPDHPIQQSLSYEDKNRFAGKLRNSHVTIVLSSSGLNTSSRALSMLFLAETLKKDYHVDHIKLIGPALPFMRNDRIFRKTNPDGSISHQFNAVACKLYARQLARAGVDQVVGFEPHSRDGVKHYRHAFGKKNVSFVNMGAFFAESIRKEFDVANDTSCNIIVGSPDGMNKVDHDKRGNIVYDYGVERAISFGEALYHGTIFEKYAQRNDFRERPYMFGIHKERINSKETQIVGFHGDVKGKICIIIDDIISGGSTTLHAAEELKKRGATKVIAVATHGVLVNGALHKLLNSLHLDRIMMTDTIPGVLDKLNGDNLLGHKKLRVESISPLVNREIARDFILDDKHKGQAQPTPQAG